MSDLFNGAKAAALVLTTLGLLNAPSPTQAASPSELLEKGIYSEETKGDLDGAVKIYQQAVAEAKTGDAVAAQAQYRMGVCYYKKKNYTEANAAFEKLLSNYPDQKDLVKLASKYLSSAVPLLPAPWVDGEELRFDIKFPTGFGLGTARYAVDAGEANGQKTWRLSTSLFAIVQQASRVEVEADSFKPLHSHWKHTLIGDAEGVYAPAGLTLTMKGKDPKQIDLQGVYYDNEEAIQLIRRLPLATNYSTTLRVITTLGGGNCLPIKAEVVSLEQVHVPAGTYDCYKVELSVNQTFWYSTDAHRYLVKFEGGGVVAELTAVNQRKPSEPAKYQDPALGFSLTAPSEWMFFRPEDKADKGETRILVIDPDATANTGINVQSLDSLKADAKASLRAWAESVAAEGAKAVKDLKVRPDSWQERTVGGAPAISVVADFMDGKDKAISYGVFTFSGTNAIEFKADTKAEDFGSFRPKFDAIVESFRAN